MQCRTCGEHGKEGLSSLDPEQASLLPQDGGSNPDFVCHDCVVEIQHWRHFLTRFQTSQTLFQQVLESKQRPDTLQQTDVEASLESILPKCRVLVAKLLQCDACSFFTNSKSQLETHMQDHFAPNTSDGSGGHPANPNYGLNYNDQCGQCGIKYGLPEMLVCHMENCHGADAIIKGVKIGKQRIWQCVLCASQHAKMERMIYHLREKHKISNLPFCCSTCGVKFLSKHQLQEHEIKKHQISPISRVFKRMKCDKCKASYVQREMLDWHTKYCHGPDAIVKMISTGNSRKYQCNLCKTVENHLHLIIFHLSGKHRFKNLPFHCNHCDKQFVIMHNLRQHQLKCNSNGEDEGKKVSEKNGVKCKICNAIFGSETNLKRHITRIHAKIPRVRCRYCEQFFPSNKQLFKHCRNNHPGKIILECEICNLEFASYNGYFFHTKYKHSSHNLSCKICPKKFTYP